MANEYMRSFDHRLIEAQSRPSGFDYLRITLALLVLFYSALTITYGEGLSTQLWHGPLRPLIAIVGPMFFSMSGFLVAGSLARCRSLVEFAGLRILRILPALIVEVLLSAMLLGPFFTTLQLGQYFTDLRVYGYLLNVVGSLHFELPGVFNSNSMPSVVNIQLWVLPREVRCYLLIAFLAAFGCMKPTRQSLLMLVLVHVAASLYLLFTHRHVHDLPTMFNGYLLLLCFIDGMAMYVHRHRIVHTRFLLLGAALTSLALLTFSDGAWFASLPVSYVAIWLGLCNPRRWSLLEGQDYSYGIFLYAYPVQQAVVAAMPALSHRLTSLAIGMPCTLALAAASWWLVERPMQRLRPRLGRIGDEALEMQNAVRLRMSDWLRRKLSNE